MGPEEERSRIQQIIAEEGDVTVQELQKIAEDASPKEMEEIYRLFHDSEEPEQ